MQLDNLGGEVRAMRAQRLRQALGLTLAGFVLAAAITMVSAQEGFMSIGASTAAVVATSATTFGSTDVGAAAVVAAEEGVKVDIALADEETTAAVTLAQTPPPPAGTSESATASTQPVLLNERAWSDGHTTIVECTGDVTRTCQVNIYGPNGEFILGRKISPNAEATDCSGPCLDSTGAALDASSVSRAQAAIAAASQSHKVIVSAGAPLPPAAVEAPAETEAERLHVEGE